MVTVIKKGISKTSLRHLVKKTQVKKGIDAQKYCGVIKLKEHPVDIQKNLRDEWE
ncbi:hypothetical protein [Umezakia ovalisporum]|uniref:hypothetical protein n=1 Tax=Umezakia ovalisporum TaxID=75695 RepID=UPI0039C623C5